MILNSILDSLIYNWYKLLKEIKRLKFNNLFKRREVIKDDNLFCEETKNNILRFKKNKFIKRKIMELQTAIEIVEYHQKWRLGKREDMIHDPKKLTEALGIVIEAANLYKNQLLNKE
jgi:hypothetical protein